jgi:hypothetical protein
MAMCMEWRMWGVGGKLIVGAEESGGSEEFGIGHSRRFSYSCVAFGFGLLALGKGKG